MKHPEFIPAVVGFAIATLVTLFIDQWNEHAPIESFQRTVSHTNVKGGDIVTVTWSEKRSHRCSSMVYRRLIAADGQIIEFEPDKEPSRPIGVPVTGGFTFKIPFGLRTGPLIYRVRAEFTCNAVQRMFGGTSFVTPDIVLVYYNQSP